MQQRLQYCLWSGNIMFEPIHTLEAMFAMKPRNTLDPGRRSDIRAGMLIYFLPKAGCLFHGFTAPTSYMFVPTLIFASHEFCMLHWLPELLPTSPLF